MIRTCYAKNALLEYMSHLLPSEEELCQLKKSRAMANCSCEQGATGRVMLSYVWMCVCGEVAVWRIPQGRKRDHRDADVLTWISCVSACDVDKCTCILEIGVTFSPTDRRTVATARHWSPTKCIICTHINKLESGRRARAWRRRERSRVKVSIFKHTRDPGRIFAWIRARSRPQRPRIHSRAAILKRKTEKS